MRPLSIARRVFLTIILCCASAAPALADGKIFTADSVLVPATMPDQQALIHFADGMQALVIETSFAGEGERFAWVVPLPSVPEVSAVSHGLFPTLQSVFRPHIVDAGPRLAALFVGLLTVFTLGLYRRRLGSLYRENVGCLGTVLLAVAAALALFMMLPSLFSPQGLNLETAGLAEVTIHSNEQIGSYEVAILSAAQPDGLIRWLTSNDFRVEHADEAIISDYVAQGWSFSAVKLSRERSDGGPASPHPLAFRFKTDAAVYPLRLTGTQKEPLSLDLFVFGPGRAMTDHPELTLVQCGATERRLEGADHLPLRKTDDKNIALVHPRLCELVPGTPFATKLSGTLDPAAMARDVRIAWEPPKPFRPTLYTAAGLRAMVTNWAVGISCVSIAAFMLLVRRGRLLPGSGAVLSGLAGLTVLAAGWMTYAYVPTTALRPPHTAALSNQVVHEMLLPKELFARPAWPPKQTFEDAGLFREAFQVLLRQPIYARNNFTGQPRIEEDSPGNYGIRQTEAGVEYLWYDQDGGEHAIRLVEAMNTWPDRPPSSLPETPAIEGN